MRLKASADLRSLVVSTAGGCRPTAEHFSSGKPARSWMCASGLRPVSPTTELRAGPDRTSPGCSGPATRVRCRAGLRGSHRPRRESERQHAGFGVRRSDLTGANRARARGRAYALAGSSTLNRLELGSPETARDHRYRRVAADEAKLDGAVVDAFLEMHATPREYIVIDLGLLPSLLLSAPLHHLRLPGTRRTDPPIEPPSRAAAQPASGVPLGTCGRRDRDHLPIRNDRH